VTPDIDPSSGLPIGTRVATGTAQRPQRATLAGRLVNIVPLDPVVHGNSLYEGSHGPGRDQLWLYLWEGPFPTRAAFDADLERKKTSEDPLYFSILDRASGLAQGHAAYLRIEPRQRVIEVGAILYTPRLQRTAAATEAMYLMAKHVFEDMGYRRYEWKCDALNEPSRRAAVRLGFSFEGVFRQHMIVKGRNRDTAWYAMLDSEWPARKAAFERWLDPANFDEQGKQKTSLSRLMHDGASRPAAL
jgi:RimJ/RimL family protein N-acetyltransferase